MDGPCGKFNLVLDEEPRLDGCAPGAEALQRAQFTLVPWLEDAQRCYESARRGAIHDRLWIDCLVPSLIDPSLATQGHHVMTCFVQYLPYSPAPPAGQPRATAAGAVPAAAVGTRARRGPLAGRASPVYTRRPRGRIRHHRGKHLPRRPATRPAVLHAPRAGLRPLRHAVAPVPVRRRHAPRRRRYRCAGTQRSTPDPRRSAPRPLTAQDARA